jgi:hypothetical protein
MTNANTSHPTHRIYAVTKNGKNKIWNPIGALWAHQDGKGFNPRLECIPLDGAESSARSTQIPTIAGARGSAPPF